MLGIHVCRECGEEFYAHRNSNVTLCELCAEDKLRATNKTKFRTARQDLQAKNVDKSRRKRRLRARTEKENGPNAISTY